MHALSGQGIQEYRQGCHQGLTFTGGHFGNHAALLLIGLDAAIQDDTADELDVIMNHIPGDDVATGHPLVFPDGLFTLNLHEIASLGGQELVKFGSRNRHGLVLGKTAGGGFHDGESFRQELIQDYLDGFVLFLHQFVAFRCQGFLLLHGDVFFHLQFNFRNAVLEGFFHGCDLLPQSLAAGTEFVVGELVNIRINGQDFVQDGPDGLHIPVALGAENFLKNICYCHNNGSFSINLAKLRILPI